MADTQTTKEKTPLPSEQAKIDAQKKKTVDTKKWPWGVWATLGWTLLLFILPQFIIGAFLSAEQIEQVTTGENIGLNFGVLVAGEIITFGFLLSILGSRKKHLRDIFVVPAKISDMFLSIPTYGIYLVSAAIAFFIAGQFIDDQTLDAAQEVGFETTMATPLEQVLVFIGLVLFVPFIEEALFRGFMLKGFVSRIGWVPAAILSSLLFGLAHLQLNVSIDTFLLGMAAAWLVYFSKSIWPAVVLHAIKNCVAFLILFDYFSI